LIKQKTKRKKLTYGPNDGCRHLGPRSVQSARLKVMVMMGVGVGTVVAGVHAVMVVVERRGGTEGGGVGDGSGSGGELAVTCHNV
jgi:hypothetical protein